MTYEGKSTGSKAQRPIPLDDSGGDALDVSFGQHGLGESVLDD
jgi:hypothetical protein